ncbi:TPA: hypothetical protein NKQ43_002638 [Vibrio parahaemolyticus]|uniref:hypothetical protein n=1 Tax=Vibrio parahaemolyticus TaxID=670 RepID=UPI00094315A5|nr:hypothetical protein [Vibrio parahaemolyticus]OKY47568.1 hypothetical protein BUL36_19270 [Vibrio parahaemolyticus]HCE2579732.1 hypothetical protein [Vibrio parahaemolyticus]HCE2726364.1 hypothetical protein [Vibrio parahaemolyticus]HCE2809233.1 hypothetical protein [Vibrio parahaemolyticus]HCG8781752.1 hypothetical protein [Vibrio parahaemolyticus]
MTGSKKNTMFDNWGEFQLNPDFTSKYQYNEKLTVDGKSVVNIANVARETKVKNTTIIKHAIANNIAIPRQPKKQEGKVRGKSGESLFQALIFGAIDMNDIVLDHDGWDFEVECSGCKVEVKTTAPQDGSSGNANLSQGDKPDVYVIFKFNNVGKFRAVYLIPVDVMKARTGKVPSSLKINKGSWVNQFEVTLGDLQHFFKLAGDYSYVYGASSLNRSKVFTKAPYNLELLLNIVNYHFYVGNLFLNPRMWWRTYIRLRASVAYYGIPMHWSWSK